MVRRPLLFLCCSWLLTACATEVSSHPAALPSYPVHVSKHGWYSATFPATMNKTTAGVKKAVQQLGMRYDAVTENTPSTVVIDGITTHRDMIQVKVTTINSRSSLVSFHSGYLGNKPLSLHFFEILDKELKL
jgi:hypothetical protein